MILSCSNCNTKLVNIQDYKPIDGVDFTVVAHCWKCGDKSFEEVLHSHLSIGRTDESFLKRQTTDDAGVIHFETSKPLGD